MTQNNSTSLAFSYDQFFQNAAASARHPYFDANVYVTNSGLYTLDIAEARLSTRKAGGVMRQCVELRAFAHNQQHDHEGRVILRIDTPDPINPQPFDIHFQAFSLVCGVCEEHQDQEGRSFVVPNFGEQVVTKFERTYTELTALKNKRLLVILKAVPSNGRIFINAAAFFTIEGYSAGEVFNKAQQQGLQPTEIKNTFIPPFEGNAAEPVQKPNAAPMAANGFSPNAFAAPQMQQAPQQAPQMQQAPQPQQQQPSNAFAAPQPTQPAAPQYQPANAFAVAQQQQQAPQQAPQMQQPQQQQQQQQASQQQAPSPYAAMNQSGPNDDIPF